MYFILNIQYSVVLYSANEKLVEKNPQYPKLDLIVCTYFLFKTSKLRPLQIYVVERYVFFQGCMVYFVYRTRL